MIFRIALLAIALVLSAPTASLASGQDEFQTLETDYFRFEYTKPDSGIAEHLARNAERIRADLTYLVGYDFKAVTRVIIAPDSQSYQSAQPRAAIPEWSVGAAFASKNMIVLLSSRAALAENKRFDPLTVFKHEVSHIILGRALAGQSIPRWLDEGIAKLVSEPWNSRKTWDMTLAILAGNNIPLHKLVHSWPKDSKRAHIAYLESHAFADYLFRHAAIRDVVASLRQKQSVEEALYHAMGIGILDLERLFDNFLDENYTWINLMTGSRFLWSSMTLLFMLVVIATYFKNRRKLRRMELEDELEDLGHRMESLESTERRRKENIIRELNRSRGENGDGYDA